MQDLSVNSLAKDMQAFIRIAKDAILQDLCLRHPRHKLIQSAGMGVSVNSLAKDMQAQSLAYEAILCPKSMMPNSGIMTGGVKDFSNPKQLDIDYR